LKGVNADPNGATNVWDEAKLDTYLADPKAFLPKNKMALAPVKRAKDRADLIAYLKSLKP
jgi:cytochrome c2